MAIGVSASVNLAGAGRVTKNTKRNKPLGQAAMWPTHVTLFIFISLSSLLDKFKKGLICELVLYADTFTEIN